MNLAVNSQTLVTDLRLLNKIAPTRPSIPILSHVLLTAEVPSALRFFATDLEVGLSSACAAQIAEPGTVALPVARLLSLVEQFADAPVVIASDKQHVTITCGAFKSRLQAMPPDDFPALPEPEGTAYALAGPAFRRLIDRTSYAVCAKDTRYFMNGALLVLAGQAAAMVATDGDRLALATMPRTGADTRILIPAKTLGVLASSESDIELTVGERHLFFTSGDRLLVSRMLDGQFPAYERIIPRDNGLVATIDRAAFAAALKRVGVVSEENKGVYIAVAPGVMNLSSSSAEVGSADEALAVQYDGAPLKVRVNGSYVLDFLDAASGSTVTLALKDEMTAFLFTDGDDHIAVIMGLRV